MLTARKSVRPLPTHQLALRYSANYSSWDHFTSDDSLRDSPSDSLSETSSDSPCDSSIAIFAGPSRKRRRSPTTLVPIALPVPGVLSPVRTDLLLPRKRIRDSDYVTDFEVDINACITFANDIAARETGVRVEVGTTTKEEAESSARGMIEIGVDRVTHPVVSDDTIEPVREDYPDLITVHRVRVIESVERDQEHRIVATSQQNAVMSEMISTLERDNMRLRGITKRVAKALEAYNAAKNPETKTEMENEQQDDNVEANGNNGNGKDNGNGNPNVNNGGVIPVTRECTYQDYVKCQPLNFKGTEGVVGLTRCFKKMETMFHISNCPPKYQVKYASCTLLNGALTWNEIQKIETKLWNLTVKGNDLTAYNQRFQELTLLCTKMVPKEEDQVRIANNLMDQKLKGYAVKNVKNKRRFDNNSRDNRGQQQPFKRQNVNGQNVARAYTVGNNVERKAYARNLPYCNKCRMHDEGPCMVKCGNCKRFGHMTRDCKAAITSTAQRPQLEIRRVLLAMSVEDKDIIEVSVPREGASPDSNVFMDMFHLNNRYASTLFDSGADDVPSSPVRRPSLPSPDGISSQLQSITFE
ncbi:putative reverse transcriptase domain-containing protein [Tanacetum coccineum]